MGCSRRCGPKGAAIPGLTAATATVLAKFQECPLRKAAFEASLVPRRRLATMQAAGALQKLGRAAVVARAGPNWGQVARMSSSGENLQEKYPKMFPRALRNILPMMCERGSWNYAEAWARDEKSDTRLRCITTFR